MEYFKLEECCEILDSKRIPITEKDRVPGNIPYYGANGIQDYVNDYIFDDELVLLAEDGGNFGSKTRPIAYRVSGKCWVNNHAHVLKPKSIVDVDFLCYSLMFYNVDSIINGATRKKLTQSAMREMKIPKLILNKQLGIVKRLKTIEKIIDDRKKQLQQLDLLIKSRFVEMFGDPIKNQFGWEQTNLKNIGIGKLTYGSGASAIDYDGNCRYIRITDIANNGLLNNEKKSPSVFDEKYLLHSGDILFARSGATVGKTFLYDEKKHGKSVYAGYLIKLTPDLTKVNSQYVFWFTKTYYYKSFVQSVQKAVAQPNINAQEYGNLTICLPPLELQNKFARFVEQVEKTKTQVQKSLDEAQLLFNSLMQEYFG